MLCQAVLLDKASFVTPVYPTISQRTLNITVSNTLYQWWLEKESIRRSQDISTVVQTALAHYIEQFDLIKTQTWQLSGTFSIAEPEAEYVVDKKEDGSITTNYAEHVDDVLY